MTNVLNNDVENTPGLALKFRGWGKTNIVSFITDTMPRFLYSPRAFWYVAYYCAIIIKKVMTINVMALSRVSPGFQDPVGFRVFGGATTLMNSCQRAL